MSKENSLSEVIDSLEDKEKAKNLQKDAENVLTLLKAAKIVAEDVFGENASFNDVITVYSLLKTEKITRVAEERFSKSGPRSLPPGVELVPIGNLLGGGNGNNGGLS